MSGYGPTASGAKRTFAKFAALGWMPQSRLVIRPLQCSLRWRVQINCTGIRRHLNADSSAVHRRASRRTSRKWRIAIAVSSLLLAKCYFASQARWITRRWGRVASRKLVILPRFLENLAESLPLRHLKTASRKPRKIRLFCTPGTCWCSPRV